MIIAQANKLARTFGDTSLFDDVSFAIQQNSRIGLVGPNGVGKSTLIKIFTGIEPPSAGEVSINKDISIGYIAQENNINPTLNIYQAMEEVFADLKQKEVQLSKMALELADNHDEDFLAKYDQLQYDFEISGGYTYQSDIKAILNGFNFDQSTYEKKVGTLSGGEKTRLAFVKLLLQKPDLLILDEPTNHLDLDTLDWLENFLKNYPGAILAISHDQYFLDAVATEILELNHGKIRKFAGNYSNYVKLRDQEFNQQEAAFEKQQQEIKRQEEFIQKNIVRASTTKRAQSRQKMLDKMEKIERPDRDQKVKIKFDLVKQTGKEVLQMQNLTVGYPDKPMVEDINFLVMQKNRVAVIGPNGIGKSTLLKTIVKELPILAGEIKYGANLQIGYYDQEINHLDPKKTVLDTVWDHHKTMLEKDVRSVLASFLFSADDLNKTVGQLSGGQRARLALTVLSLENNNFLIFDEPTNHLDIEAKEVLEQALENFPGTILFVSHDRYFINQLAQKIIAINNKKPVVYDGNYSFYLEKRGNFEQSSETKTSSTPAGKVDYQAQKEQQNKIRRLEKKVTELETDLTKIDEQISELEQSMLDPDIASDFDKLGPIQAEIDQLHQKSEAVTNEWEQAATELENQRK